MGSFVHSILTLLLGWVQGAASLLWALVNLQYEGGLFSWLSANWLPVTVLLCAAGMVIDLVVYLLRWRPLEVWRSFFRRLRSRRENQPAHRLIRRWVYADGSSLEEQVGEVPAEASESPSPVTETPPRRADRRRAMLRLPSLLTGDDDEEQPISFQPAPPARDKAQAFGRPCYPPGWSSSGQRTGNPPQGGGCP